MDWTHISSLVTHNSRHILQFSSVANSGLVSIVRPIILFSAVSFFLIASCSVDEYLIESRFVNSYLKRDSSLECIHLFCHSEVLAEESNALLFRFFTSFRMTLLAHSSLFITGFVSFGNLISNCEKVLQAS